MANIGPTVSGVLDAVHAHADATRARQVEAEQAAAEHYDRVRAERAADHDDETDDDA